MSVKHLPIFALSTVLFPQGMLPLRVFEARYVDMVRQCLRENEPFGVCLISEGQEVGAPAHHESVGCMARIVDWDSAGPGVLGILVQGTQRFAVRQRSIECNGLIRAEVEPIADDPVVGIAAEHDACVRWLRDLIQATQARRGVSDTHAAPEPTDDDPTQPATSDQGLAYGALESSGWVANRLAEMLPVPAGMRQQWMAMMDPAQRLAQVHAVMRRWIIE
jgi:uncharacterized protein